LKSEGISFHCLGMTSFHVCGCVSKGLKSKLRISLYRLLQGVHDGVVAVVVVVLVRAL